MLINHGLEPKLVNTGHLKFTAMQIPSNSWWTKYIPGHFRYTVALIVACGL